ncbi:hypothetical protein [Arthrobacter sp. FW306-04-A]|uniref:hypothetical protein n=1 Tax=Arthrobacter sp. FW306-04-A TaxID=2879619 RepID=UPI0037BE7B25|nr:hypothetical protein LFT43_17285 [Arthrobacter sp. FW306-04-A]
MKESKAVIWLTVAATVAIAALDGLRKGLSIEDASYGTLTRRVIDTTPQTSFAYMTLIGALLSGVFLVVQTLSLIDVAAGDGTMLVLAAVAAAAGQIVRPSLSSVSAAPVQPPSESLPAHIDEGSSIQWATGHDLNLRGSSRLGVIYGIRRPHNTYGQEF